MCAITPRAGRLVDLNDRPRDPLELPAMRMHSPILRAPRASARSRGGAPVRLIVTAVMLGMWLPATASAADAAAAGRASGPATALESVSLTLSSGRPLTVWLRVPEAAAQAPMPAAVVLGGFETGGGVLDLLLPRPGRRVGVLAPRQCRERRDAGAEPVPQCVSDLC